MNQHARVGQQPIPFIDVAAQRRRLGKAIDEAVGRVLGHCQFILGPEVRELESQLAAFSGARHAVSCASGTDALTLVLLAKGVGAGDAVFCPSFTFAASVEVPALLGASPVFVDVEEETFNIDALSLERAVATAKKLGLSPKAVIPVDLFGLPADHDSIAEVAEAEGLFVLDDAAQGFGASYKGKKLGTFGLVTATSFFPAKPLGCYGDGGAVFTDDDGLAETVRGLRVHGQMPGKSEFSRLGVTGRLDTIQAAVLIEKLKIFQDEIEARNRIARRYRRKTRQCRHRPARAGRLHFGMGAIHDSAAFGRARRRRRGAEGRRDSNRHLLRQASASARGLQALSGGDGGLPVTERLSHEVISLPMHAYLDEPTQDRIVDAVKRALSR